MRFVQSPRHAHQPQRIRRISNRWCLLPRTTLECAAYIILIGPSKPRDGKKRSARRGVARVCRRDRSGATLLVTARTRSFSRTYGEVLRSRSLSAATHSGQRTCCDDRRTNHAHAPRHQPVLSATSYAAGNQPTGQAQAPSVHIPNERIAWNGPGLASPPAAYPAACYLPRVERIPYVRRDMPHPPSHSFPRRSSRAPCCMQQPPRVYVLRVRPGEYADRQHVR